MVVASWKSGINLFNGISAQAVADEIISIGDSALPKQIVDKARDSSTELHKCFEWDDSIAAEKYRIEQARDVVQCLVIKKKDDAPAEEPEVRYFYKTDSSSGYKPSEVIFRQEDEYQKLLNQAYNELRAFKVKYAMLTELEKILELID